MNVETESLKQNLLAKLIPAYTAPWAEQFLRDLCRLAETYGSELKELIDSIQPSSFRQELAKERERRERMEQRLVKLNEENQAAREKESE